MTTPAERPSTAPSPKAIAGKRFAIYGLGVTGRAMCRFLLQHGGQVIALDDAPADQISQLERDALEEAGVELIFQPTAHDWMRLLPRVGALIPSPGIAVSRLILDMTTQNKVEVLAELDLAGDYAQGRVVSVTGTNGKSTISAWIHWLLREAGQDSRLGGNYGIPTVDTLQGGAPQSWYVWEVSSYQLEGTHRFHPAIAVLCNITPDHLHRHGTVAAYMTAKMRQFARQGPHDVAIVNLDDRGVMDALASHPLHPETRCWGYGLDSDAGHAGCTGDELWIKIDDARTPLCRLSDLPVPGKHNASNALAVALAALAANLSIDEIRTHLVSFRGLPHRLERIPSADGLHWINDSKSTNAESTLAAIASFQSPYHLILGGAEKQLDYTALYTALHAAPVQSIIGMGPTGMRIAEELTAGSCPCPVSAVANLKDAVALIRQHAAPEAIVLFSPGAPSFNEFRNFEERGESLRSLVASHVPASTPVSS